MHASSRSKRFLICVVSGLAAATARAQDPPSIQSTIELGGLGGRIAYDDGSRRAFVTVPMRDEVVEISLRTHRIERRIAVGEHPYGVALGDDGRTLFVALGAPPGRTGRGGRGRLEIVDLSNDDRTSIELSDDSSGFVDPELTVLAPDRVLVNAAAGGFFVTVDFGPDGAAVRRFDLALLDATLEISPDRRSLFAGGRAVPSLVRLDLSAADPVVVPLALPASVSDTSHLASSPDGQWLWVRSGQALDTRTGLQVGETVAGAHGFGANADLVFVATTLGEIEVFVSATGERIDAFALGCGPLAVVDLVVLPADRGFIVLADDVVCVLARAPDCPSAPSVPDSPSPPPAALFVPTDTVLSWRSSPSTCAETFDVWLDTVDPPAARVAVGTTIPFVRAGSLDPGVEYFWRVVTTNATGTVAGPTWTFRTEPCEWPRTNFDGAKLQRDAPLGRGDT